MSDHQYSAYFDLGNGYCDVREEVLEEEVQNNVLSETGTENGAVNEMLIDAVRSYPHLYDKSSKDFKDIVKRNNSWREIAEILNLPVEECQTRWIRLREKFSREKRIQEEEERSGSGISHRHKFNFMRNMQFLHKFVKTRSAYTNVATATVSKLKTESAGSGQNKVDGKLGSLSCGNLNETYSQLLSYDKTDNEANISSLKKQHTETAAAHEISQNSTPKTGKRKRPEVNLDPVEKSLLQMSSNIASQMGQQDSAELAFGKYIGMELQKVPEPSRTKKKKQIMEILWE